MGIKYGLIAYQNRPISQFSYVVGNHEKFSLRIIKSISPHVKNAFCDYSDYVFTVKIASDGVIFLCLSTKDVDLQTQNQFLDEIDEQFSRDIANQIEVSFPNSASSILQTTIKNSIDKYNQNRSILPLDRQMSNIHINYLSNEVLSINDSDIAESVPRNKVFYLKFLRLLSKRNRKTIAYVVMLLIVVLTLLFFVFKKYDLD